MFEQITFKEKIEGGGLYTPPHLHQMHMYCRTVGSQRNIQGIYFFSSLFQLGYYL